MSEERKKGPWFRLTDQEREHIDRMMAEADAWQPGMPPPEHSIEEHMEAARLELMDIKAQTQRLRLMLWVLTWIVSLGLLVFALVRWLT